MNYDLQLCVPYGVCVCVFGNVGRWTASNDLDLDLPQFSLLVTTILRSSVSHPLHSVLCVCVYVSHFVLAAAAAAASSSSWSFVSN